MSAARKKVAAEAGNGSEAAPTTGATETTGAAEATPVAATPVAASPVAAATETCPWCSATVSAGGTKCPSCGASLRDAVDGDVLGVTQIDPAAVSRASRIKPGRLATWLGADSTAEENGLGGHVEPPSKEVREEMLRLELAAIDAEIEAKRNAAEAQRILPDEDAPEPKPS